MLFRSCVSAAIALSFLLDRYLDPALPENPEEESEKSEKSDGPATTSGAADAGKATPKKNKKAGTATPDAQPSILDVLSPYLPGSKKTDSASAGVYGLDTRAFVLLQVGVMLLYFVTHCTWVTANAYSSPSVVLSSRNQDGSQHIIDDFREAYYWLRQNTPETAVVMSWWDYGYQIAGMADRPTLVDNNTWNNSE